MICKRGGCVTNEFAVAVHALVFLNHKGCCQSSEKIAKNICSNPARIRKVLSRLKKAGLVETKEGLDGGYLFAKDSHAVTLAQICRAAEVTPISVSWRSGSEDLPCLIASGMAGVMDDIYADLNQACYERLEETTLADIDGIIFKD